MRRRNLGGERLSVCCWGFSPLRVHRAINLHTPSRDESRSYKLVLISNRGLKVRESLLAKGNDPITSAAFCRVQSIIRQFIGVFWRLFYIHTDHPDADR